MPQITIVFSAQVELLAQALAEGALDAGADVTLRRASEAGTEELAGCDGLALGCGSLFGAPDAELAGFLSRAQERCRAGDLDGRPATAFAQALTAHGGAEATLLSLHGVFCHWGCIIVPAGLKEASVFPAGGNPYGTAWVAPDQDVPAGAEALGAAQFQGHRLARVAGQVRP